MGKEKNWFRWKPNVYLSVFRDIFWKHRRGWSPDLGKPQVSREKGPECRCPGKKGKNISGLEKDILWLGMGAAEQNRSRNAHSGRAKHSKGVLSTSILANLPKWGGHDGAIRVVSHLVRCAKAGRKAWRKGPQGLDRRAGNRVS